MKFRQVGQTEFECGVDYYKGIMKSHHPKLLEHITFNRVGT